MRTFFQTREINEKNFKSGINSKYVFFREIEHSRNLNFSSNQKIDVTIIFQIRETNKKNETSSNQELIQSVFLFRQIPQIWIFLLEKVTSSIDRFLFERQSFHAYIFLNQRDKWRQEWNNETSIPLSIQFSSNTHDDDLFLSRRRQTRMKRRREAHFSRRNLRSNRRDSSPSPSKRGHEFSKGHGNGKRLAVDALKLIFTSWTVMETPFPRIKVNFADRWIGWTPNEASE